MKISSTKPLLLGIILITLISCNNFKKTENGLEYKIFPSNETNQTKLKQDDLVELRMLYKTENGDTIFQSTSERKYMRKVSSSSHLGGSFEDGLLLLSLGDSAVFRILADNFLLKTEKYPDFPKNVKSGDYIIIYVKIIDIVEKSDIEHILGDIYHSSKDVENSILQDYLLNANIRTQANEDGIYIITKKTGSGNLPNATDYVTMDYTVTLIDGTFIETTLSKRPFTFRLGTNSVITGLEKAVLKMKTNEEATIIIPSDFAYGETGTNGIFPYSTLIFDVTIIKIQ